MHHVWPREDRPDIADRCVNARSACGCALTECVRGRLGLRTASVNMTEHSVKDGTPCVNGRNDLAGKELSQTLEQVSQQI